MTLWDKFFIVFFSVALLFLTADLFRKYLYVKTLNVIKKISGGQLASFAFAACGFIKLILTATGFPRNDWFNSNFRDITSSLIYFTGAVALFNYNFITEEGLFIGDIGGRLLKWSNIQSWKWKEWHESVALISYRNKKGKLRTMKFNVSKKHAREFEETLNEFVLKGK